MRGSIPQVLPPRQIYASCSDRRARRWGRSRRRDPALWALVAAAPVAVAALQLLHLA